VFVGFPVAMAIFGEKGMIFAIFYFLANTTCFNTLAYLLISRDGEILRTGKAAVSADAGDMLSLEGAGNVAGGFLGDAAVAQPPKITAASMIKRVMQPPVITIFVAIFLVLLGIKLPDFANSTIAITSGITSPLSLIFVGTILHRVGFKSMKFEKGLSWVMVGRFILAPLVMLGVAALYGLEPFASHVFITQMALPVMVTAVIYAEACGADSSFATRGMVMSTLLSLIMLPILVILFGG
jgi:predicted permease